MVELIHFNRKEFLEGEGLQERVGLRGRNMLELAQLDLPIVPGFLVESKDLLAGLKDKLTIADLQVVVSQIESISKKSFGKRENPLLFKAVVSASIQIGTIRSIHAVGLNDESVQGVAAACGDDFAYGEYRILMEEIGSRFLKKKKSDFKDIVEANSGASEKEICALYREKVVPDFPQDAYEQLRLSLAELAAQYMDDPMNEGIEAGLLVQMMVYGNYGEQSYNGRCFSRDIVTGRPELTGGFGKNEFDTPDDKTTPIGSLAPEYLAELKEAARKLEEKFLDIRQIKFVIEQKTFWLVEQNPVDAKSTRAEIRTLLDLKAKNLISAGKMVSSVPAAQLRGLLLPIINHQTTASMPKVVGGIAGSPGAAVGRVAFSTPALLAEYKRCTLQGINASLILVMPHTDAEDVEAIELGVATIASVGGYASHAPVVSRSLRKPCLLFSDIQYHEGYIIMGGQRINEFDTISMEVPTHIEPTVWLGEADLVPPDTSENGLEDFMAEVSKLPTALKVYGNAENLTDIKTAIRLGAEGIGQFPMDCLLKKPDTLAIFREALLVVDPEARKNALAEVEKCLEKDVLEIFNILEGRHIVFRLLNHPLNEFLPHSSEDKETTFAALASKHPDTNSEEFGNRASQLRNINPMMGLRGSRIAINYPDLYATQVRGIFKAAEKYSEGGKKPLDLELSVPAVMSDAEMRFIRYGRNIESTTIPGIETIGHEIFQSNGDGIKMKYSVGASIELPAAAIMAGHLAKQSDFFSMDINMLTQTTNGMSMDDINLFLPSYTQYDILEADPFLVLSLPVKELIFTAIQYGRMIRPDLRVGLSGDSVSDAANMEFAHETKLDFVTCSPYGVPVAKLSAVQKALKEG